MNVLFWLVKVQKITTIDFAAFPDTRGSILPLTWTISQEVQHGQSRGDEDAAACRARLYLKGAADNEA